jgi:hypothetical protein
MSDTSLLQSGPGEPPTLFDEVCDVDGEKIVVMTFKGTGVCCEYCRKVRDKEITDDRVVS